MIPELGAALGVGALLAGLMIAIAGTVGTRGPARPPSALGTTVARLFGVGLSHAARTTRQTLLAVAAFALVASWLYSGIPLVGIAVALGIVGTPWLFGAGRADTRMVERLEAIEIWTRRLADLVRSGAGLHQAIVSSALEAPRPIASEVVELATEMRGSMSTVDALRSFADRLGDANSDEVIAALILNARERGPRLADVLDRVSESMADTITMRREQSSARADARISGMVLSALMMGGLVLLLVNRTYMKPYHSGTGQIVLAACLVTFAGLLVWCRQLNAPRRVPRLLQVTTPSGGQTS